MRQRIPDPFEGQSVLRAEAGGTRFREPAIATVRFELPCGERSDSRFLGGLRFGNPGDLQGGIVEPPTRIFASLGLCLTRSPSKTVITSRLEGWRPPHLHLSVGLLQECNDPPVLLGGESVKSNPGHIAVALWPGPPDDAIDRFKA